ncbi:TPA: hypothetical protein DD449_05220 [Candidatus Berkelbacteria bacterium]|uniref:LVIVD repeat protein n=1 Tax=Berkelbacteria bacterium GW2011_GWE1_39_12 TaxID=1618337 RepID=A0A0G4B3D5_9BACT|nr:MAG: LVIVD repeat protein [Berkelbacteria bacterium GW2011_GWE1_39_12]HBO61053.1 hypothetical protein [Candidatus Berkelbacteria bacterium]
MKLSFLKKNTRKKNAIIAAGFVLLVAVIAIFLIWLVKNKPQASDIVGDVEIADFVKAPKYPSHLLYSEDQSRLYTSDQFGVRIFDIADEENPIEIGEYSSASVVQDMLLDQNMLYVLLTNRIKVINVANPASLVLVKEFTFRPSSNIYMSTSMDLYQGKLYIGDDNPEIWEINVNDPSNPIVERLINIKTALSRYSRDLVVKKFNGKPYIFVANDADGLKIVDLETGELVIALPVTRIDGEADSARAINFNGNYLYLGASNSNLQVIGGFENLGTPEFNPQVVDRAFPEKAWGFLSRTVLVNNHLYAVNSDIIPTAGAYVFDVSNPADLVWLPGPESTGSGFIPNPNFPTQGVSRDLVYTKNGYLIVSDDTNLFDVFKPNENPGSIRTNNFIKRAPTLHGTYDVSFLENRGMVAVSHTGIDLFDASNPEKPIYKSSYGRQNVNVLLVPNSGTGAATTKGNLVFFSKSDPDSQFVIADATDLNQPQYISSLVLDPSATLNNGSWNAKELLIKDNLLFLAGGSQGNVGLYTIDITDIANPVLKSFIKLGQSPWRIAESGGYVYYGDSGQGLITLDVSDPANPKIVTPQYLDGNGQPIDTNNPNVLTYSHYLVYTNFYNGFYIFDVADHLNPVFVTHYHDGYMGGWGYDVVGNLLYSGGNTSGMNLCVYDIENPLNPRRLTCGGRTEFSEAETKLKVYNGLAFATGTFPYTAYHVRIMRVPVLLNYDYTINMTVSDDDEKDQIKTTSNKGEILEYKINYSNTGNAPLTNITISSNVPTLTNYDSGGVLDPENKVVNFSIDSLAPGISGTVFFKVKANSDLADGNYEITNSSSILANELSELQSNEVISNIFINTPIPPVIPPVAPPVIPPIPPSSPTPDEPLSPITPIIELIESGTGITVIIIGSLAIASLITFLWVKRKKRNVIS